MARRLKIGVIGLGAIGNTHLAAYKAVNEADIVAGSDIDSRKLTQFTQQYSGARGFSNYKDLLKTDLDAVLVCVGNALHRSVAIDALKSGKHVFLEKPMAMNAREAEDIVAASDKAKGILQMGMVLRQNPHAKAIRNYIQNGLFGDIYHIRIVLIRRRGIPGLGGWFTTKSASGGGPMIDLGVHWFDVTMWMTGCWTPQRVSAQTYAKFGPRMKNYRYVSMWAGPPKFDGKFDVEDYSTGFARFAGSVTMSFEIAWAANAEDEGYADILGDKAGVRVTGDMGKPIRILTEQQEQVANIEPLYNTSSNLFEDQARSFLAACRGDAKPAATAREGATVMRLIDSIYASSKAGKEVEVIAPRKARR